MSAIYRKQMVPLCLAVCSSFICSGAQAVDYNIIDLGTFGGNYSWAQDVNDLGQVVGSSTNSAGVYRPFIWDAANGMRDLGYVDGLPDAIPRAINNSGQVTGTASVLGNIATDTAFIWDVVNGMQNLGTLGGAYSQGRDINNSGQVVGLALNAEGNSRAFLWDAANGMQDLGTLGGAHSFGNGINDPGQVVGSAWNSNNGDQPFIWDDLNGMQDAGIGPASYFSKITNNGLAIGQAGSSAFLWDANNGMQYNFYEDLLFAGLLENTAYGLNTQGQVVGTGYLYTDPEQQDRAFLWDAETGVQDLCALVECTLNGWESLIGANAINENGDIVGWGMIGAEIHGYLIQSAVVPLPAGVWLFATGLVGLFAFGVRARR